MEIWSSKEHDFGDVQQGSTQRVEITYTGTKKILEIEPLCNCVGYKFENNALLLTWKIRKNIVTEYQSNKIVAVIYEDGSIDDLTLKAYIRL